ncbi:MAG TPA: NAD(P)-binding domain-containing protein [Gaiellales bacterium]|nr:NAD(P)-binding domain-containing protein [Gaiellales bacterium]
MRIAVLGTGVVGQTLAGKLAELGNDVTVGTRDVDSLMARTDPQPTGAPAFAVWLESHPGVSVAPFADAAAHGEIILVATSGTVAVDALRLAGQRNLDGKIVIDISNPLDFSSGFPPTLAVCNTDSIGERVQRAFPGARVVKTLNTVNAQVMVDPGAVGGGDHTLFMSGDDADAKARVADLLREWFGWRSVVDVGDISTARGLEMYLPLWLRLMGALETPAFNVKIVRD